MPIYKHQDVEIAYLDTGEGEPVVLVHRAAANKEDWVSTGWVAALTGAGRRVIAVDNRGHGQSSKLYDPEAYEGFSMAADVLALINHLELHKPDIIGYSMGAAIAAHVLVAEQQNIRSGVIAGMGFNLIQALGTRSAIADAFEASDDSDVVDDIAREFRAFARHNGNDLKAVGACFRGTRVLSRDLLRTISVPVLIAIGTEDEIVRPDPDGGSTASALAKLIPGARTLEVPGRNHMEALADNSLKQAVLSFLDEQSSIHR